jgi:hypothetical protein
MNIFVLHPEPMQAAIFHCDKHCVKMVLESAQMLCTNLNLKDIKTPYKSCHVNHPCTIWARETRSNYTWLCELGLSLCWEYTFRYGKTHASEKVINFCYERSHLFPEGELTQFAQAMPDEYKSADPVQAYRNYYIGAKKDFAVWSKRQIPDWFVIASELSINA